MSTAVIAPHDQRRFLMVAFHPYGSDVCNLLGLLRPSLDVDESERKAAGAPWYDLMGYGSGGQHTRKVTTIQIVSLAQLYEAAAASLINVDHPHYHRSLGEDLVSFFIALVSLGDIQ